jgi:hypothetical protein
MRSASRTLVMSPPELWELIDQPDRMQGLMCALVGRATEVTVNKRSPESVLRWEASDNGADAWIEVELAEKGWGTNVKLKAENGAEPTKLEGWLDAVLEELATPQKRPFAEIGQPTEPKPPPELAAIEPSVEETPAAEAPAAEAPAAEAPAAEAPAAEAPAAETTPPPPPKKKRRRFFGF